MKVLCAVDGSEFSYWAVEALGTLFHETLKEVVLLHVVDDVQLKQGLKNEGMKSGKIKKVLSAMKAEAETILTVSEKKATLAINQARTRSFISIRPVLAHGHVTDTIIKQAEKRKVDVIVMGSRGLSDIKGYLMGSVSRKVLTHTPCSVLTVKEPLPERCQAIIAVDGSHASKRAATSLKKWVMPSSVSIHVLSVVPQFLTDVAPKVLSKSHVKALTEPFQLRAHQLTAQYRELFLKEGYAVTTDVKDGDPKRVILNSIEGKKVNLAVLGTKGLTGPERFQMGSVSEWVATYTPCSVFVVRPR